MFNAQYINAATGKGKESGKQWYRVQLICQTISGGHAVGQFWTNEQVYNSCKALADFEQVRVACGVDDNGRLTLADIKQASAAAKGRTS